MSRMKIKIWINGVDSDEPDEFFCNLSFFIEIEIEIFIEIIFVFVCILFNVLKNV